MVRHSEAIPPHFCRTTGSLKDAMTADSLDLPEGLLAAARAEATAIASDVHGVQAVVIATADGLNIASSVHGTADAGRLAALGSSIAAIGEFVSAEAGHGRSTGITLASDAGFAVVHAFQTTGPGLVLNVLADAAAAPEHVKRRAAEAVRRLAR